MSLPRRKDVLAYLKRVETRERKVLDTAGYCRLNSVPRPHTRTEIREFYWSIKQECWRVLAEIDCDNAAKAREVR